MITFIYFDIGGVVIKDFSVSPKWQQMQLDLGLKPSQLKAFNALWNELVEPRVNLDYDVDNFMPVLRQRFHLNLPANYSLLNDFVSRFEPNRFLWPLIDNLKKEMKVGLLTNLYPCIFSGLQKAQLLPPVNWDTIIDSSVELLQKPDPKIYLLAQDRANVTPHQILFIDNAPKNLSPAKQLGWQTFWYDSKDYAKSTQQLTKYIKELH